MSAIMHDHFQLATLTSTRQKCLEYLENLLRKHRHQQMTDINILNGSLEIETELHSTRYFIVDLKIDQVGQVEFDAPLVGEDITDELMNDIIQILHKNEWSYADWR